MEGREIYLGGFCASVLLVRSRNGSPRESHKCGEVTNPQLLRREARLGGKKNPQLLKLLPTHRGYRVVAKSWALESELLSDPSLGHYSRGTKR